MQADQTRPYDQLEPLNLERRATKNKLMKRFSLEPPIETTAYQSTILRLFRCFAFVYLTQLG